MKMTRITTTMMTILMTMMKREGDYDNDDDDGKNYDFSCEINNYYTYIITNYL